MPALAGRSARALRALAPADRRARTTQIACLSHSYSVVCVLYMGMFNMGMSSNIQDFVSRRCTKTFSRRCTKFFFGDIFFCKKRSDVRGPLDRLQRFLPKAKPMLFSYRSLHRPAADHPLPKIFSARALRRSPLIHNKESNPYSVCFSTSPGTSLGLPPAETPFFYSIAVSGP